MTDVQKGEGRVIELYSSDGGVELFLCGEDDEICGEIEAALREIFRAVEQKNSVECAYYIRQCLIEKLTEDEI